MALGLGERRPCALANHLAFVLGDRRQDVNGELIGVGHVARDKVHLAVLEIGDKRHVAGEAVKLGDKQDGALTTLKVTNTTKDRRDGCRGDRSGREPSARQASLVGGDEFKPGNEMHDRLLVEHHGRAPAYVVPTAAARQRPDLAVATAQQWFKGLEAHSQIVRSSSTAAPLQRNHH
jgi:hypothetical protein